MDNRSGRLPRALCFLALAATAGCTVDPGGEPAPAPAPDIDASTARAIAAGFLNAQVESGNRPEWHGAFVDDLVAFHDSRGVVQAYEAEVVDGAREPAGWIMVEAWDVLPPVSAFTTAGPSNFAQLSARYRAERGGGTAVDEMVPLWVGPSSAALDVHEAGGAVIRIAPFPELANAPYDGEARLASARDAPGDPEDVGPASRARGELREMYVADRYDPSTMGARRVGLAGRATSFGVVAGEGSRSFSPFNQEDRPWTNGNCNTGCTPVAFGILIEYWDRNGYPTLVGNPGDDANTDHTDDDVRWLMDQLRSRMSTYCVGDTRRSAATDSPNYVRAADHINTRNAGQWTVDDTVVPEVRWLRLMGQIDVQNPVIVHYDASHQDGPVNHSAVAYEYTDNFGSDNDWICAQKGHGFLPNPEQAMTWDCFQRTTAGTYYHVTRIMRPTGAPPPRTTGTSARVTVGGITLGANQYVCAAGRNHPARRALLVGAGSYETTVPTSILSTDVDMVFWVATTPSCIGGWVRDLWPASNPYRVNGVSVTKCVPRPDNAAWSFVRGTIRADSVVTDSGTRACPGSPAPSTTARVTVGGVVPGAGQHVCASGAGPAISAGGNTYEVSLPIGVLPANVDTVFWISTSPACSGGWVRDLWPAANPYAVNGRAVTRCVPRPENAAWSYVRGTVQFGGAVADSGTRACPG